MSLLGVFKVLGRPSQCHENHQIAAAHVRQVGTENCCPKQGSQTDQTHRDAVANRFYRHMDRPVVRGVQGVVYD